MAIAGADRKARPGDETADRRIQPLSSSGEDVGLGCAPRNGAVQETGRRGHGTLAVPAGSLRPTVGWRLRPRVRGTDTRTNKHARSDQVVTHRILPVLISTSAKRKPNVGLKEAEDRGEEAALLTDDGAPRRRGVIAIRHQQHEL